jgi:hypothetical protein
MLRVPPVRSGRFEQWGNDDDRLEAVRARQRRQSLEPGFGS